MLHFSMIMIVASGKSFKYFFTSACERRFTGSARRSSPSRSSRPVDVP